jgi:hypothetical protein
MPLPQHRVATAEVLRKVRSLYAEGFTELCEEFNERATDFHERKADSDLERGRIFESEQLHAIESKNTHIEFINGSFQPSSVKEQQISEVLKAWKARMGELQDAHFDRTDRHSLYIVAAHMHMSGQMQGSLSRFTQGALGRIGGHYGGNYPGLKDALDTLNSKLTVLAGELREHIEEKPAHARLLTGRAIGAFQTELDAAIPNPAPTDIT